MMKQKLKHIVHFFYILTCPFIFFSCYTVTEEDCFREHKIASLSEQFHFKDVNYSVDDSISINGWLLTKDSAVATILFLHGNSGNLYEYPWINIINSLGRLNVNIFAIDYRGFGRSSGKLSFQGVYRDVRQALAYLKSTSYGSAPILVYGLSFGSIPAVDIAHDTSVSGLILEGALSSSEDALDATVEHHWFLHFVKIKYDKDLIFDSKGKIKNVKAPVLIIHGNNDMLPTWMSEKLFNSISHSNKRFYSVENGSHCDTYKVDSTNYIQQLNAFINRCLTNKKPN
jgi:pimeloyl-ACP methyl ester carboxylesterase